MAKRTRARNRGRKVVHEISRIWERKFGGRPVGLIEGSIQGPTRDREAADRVTQERPRKNTETHERDQVSDRE